MRGERIWFCFFFMLLLLILLFLFTTVVVSLPARSFFFCFFLLFLPLLLLLLFLLPRHTTDTHTLRTNCAHLDVRRTHELPALLFSTILLSSSALMNFLQKVTDYLRKRAATQTGRNPGRFQDFKELPDSSQRCNTVPRQYLLNCTALKDT
jgi:hypothetical protein